MNRQQRRAMSKQMGGEATQVLDLMLNLPTKCLTCEATYDKTNRDMVRTWVVDVFKSEKRVDLYCPKCDEQRKQNV